MNILVDNTVLSNLAVVRRPELLRAAFGDLLATSQEVFEELDAGVLRGKLPALDWGWLPIWALDETEIDQYTQFLRTLNAGEQVLAHAETLAQPLLERRQGDA